VAVEVPVDTTGTGEVVELEEREEVVELTERRGVGFDFTITSRVDVALFRAWSVAM